MHLTIKVKNAFTLLETLVVITLSAMILTAVLAVYNRVRASGVVILEHMEKNRLQTEILQKIAEDIDRLAAPGFEASITFDARLSNVVFRSGQLVLENNYYGNGDKKEVYEHIEWRTSYDALTDSLILYRMHEGMNLEDPVLQKSTQETLVAQPSYIPVADGITCFDLSVQQGETILSRWTNADELPRAVRIGISFAPIQELADGSIGVPIEDITYRTVAIDRTRLIPFEFIKQDLDLSLLDEEVTDPNELLEGDETGTGSDPNEV